MLIIICFQTLLFLFIYLFIRFNYFLNAGITSMIIPFYRQLELILNFCKLVPPIYVFHTFLSLSEFLIEYQQCFNEL